MKKAIAILSLLGGFGLAGCSSTGETKQASFYSAEETKRLTFCLGLADTARVIAINKLQGVPVEAVRAHYADQEDAKLKLATVDKVYSEQFELAWDYTVAFYEECAVNLAKVPEDRVRPASVCHHVTMISDVAFAYKADGDPKEKAYEHFKQVKSDLPRRIIDDVYESEKTRSRYKVDEWSACAAQAKG